MARKQNKPNVRKAAKNKQRPSNILQKAKSSMKWVLGLFAGAALTLCLVFFGIWIVGVDTSNVFPLNRLEVTGQNYTQANELYERVQAISDRGFFTMDMQQAEEELLALPWVKKIQLRKVWPETLNIQITEHQPLAYWGEQGVVSVEGKVFYPQALPEKNWVTLNGPEAIADELTQLLQMYQLQLASKQLQVQSMALTERGAVNLKLADGVDVKLGNYQVEERLGRFIAQIDNLKAYKNDPLEYVDLRYQNGLVAAWQNDASTQAAVTNGNSNR
ncbi:MAG: FtsQ-type POTRA domain-containing protein [Gammaproteobacteria bacterium]|nr:FtsQ-type POTRA domain-containing protein [Gammaproteobacteria bacterium]